jgi:hypothetical protein
MESAPGQAVPSVDEIVERVLAQAAARGSARAAEGSGRMAWSDLDSRLKGGPSASADFYRRIQAGKPFKPDKSRTYDLGDFIRLEGAEFIEACYMGLLGRHADADGRHNFLSALLAGRRKTEIVAQIRLSPEGRAYGAKVRGLFPHAVLAILFRIPLVGYLAEYVLAVITLPGVVRGVRALQAHDAYRRQQLNSELERALRRIEGEASRDR